MAYGGLESRISALEQIIIKVFVGGVWPLPGVGGPSVDPGPSDYARQQALYQAIFPHKGDPFVVDVARLSLAETEEKAHQVASEITRLQALQGELGARVKELRGKE